MKKLTREEAIDVIAQATPLIESLERLIKMAAETLGATQEFDEARNVNPELKLVDNGDPKDWGWDKLEKWDSTIYGDD